MRLPRLPHWLALGALAAGCADQGPGAAPPGGRVEVAVAPLSLPGVTGACYDLQVINADDAFVWTAGDPTASAPTDTSTICSMQYGAPGGGVTYVGSCDASAPKTTVRLYIDSLWSDATQLTDWVDPCPLPGGCVVTTDCTENEDVAVTFDLTVMRRAQQGFFDIGVNFSDVFCSAKLDCAYDAAGTEPITLLFDPATGQRGQTAVLGLACTAGPGEETVLQVSDVVVTCGDQAGDPWSSTGVTSVGSFCTEPTPGSPVVYGGAMYWDLQFDHTLTDLGTGAIGGSWSGSGFTTFPALDVSANAWDGAFPEQLVGPDAAGRLTALVRLYNGGGTASLPAPSVAIAAAGPDAQKKDGGGLAESIVKSTVTALKFVLAVQQPSGAWQTVQDLPSAADGQTVEPRSLDAATRTLLGDGVQNGRRYVFPRDYSVTDHIAYKAPVELRGNAAGTTCALGDPAYGLVGGVCGSDTVGYTLVLLDLDELAAATSYTTLPYVELTPPSITGWSAQIGRDQAPVIIDADHVFFQVFYTNGWWFVQPHLALATRTETGWVVSAPFEPADQTQISKCGSSQIKQGDYGGSCQGGHDGANGVLWGSTAGASYTGSFLAWFAADGTLLEAPSSREPYLAWLDGGEPLVLEPGPSGGIRLTAYHFVPADGDAPSAFVPTSSPELFARGGVSDVRQLRPTATGYDLVYASTWGETLAVSATRALDGSWTLGPARLLAWGETQVVTADPGADAVLANDVLNPAPCSEPLLLTQASNSYNPRTTDAALRANGYIGQYTSDLSQFMARSLARVSLATGVTTPLAQPDTSVGLGTGVSDTNPVPAWPLAHVIGGSTLWPTGFCYAEGGVDNIASRYGSFDVDLARTGITVNEFDVGTGAWPGAGDFERHPIDLSGLPALADGLVYAPQIWSLADFDDDGTPVHSALGVIMVVDARKMDPNGKELSKNQVVSATAAVFDAAGRGWTLGQRLTLPSGAMATARVYGFELDPATHALVSMAWDGGADVPVIWPRDPSAAGALRFLAPKRVVEPTGARCQSSNSGDGGVYLYVCDFPTQSSVFYAVTADDLAAAGSTVAMRPLPWLVPEGSAYGGCTAQGTVATAGGPAVVLSCSYTDPTDWSWHGSLSIVTPSADSWTTQTLAGAVNDLAVRNGFVSFSHYDPDYVDEANGINGAYVTRIFDLEGGGDWVFVGSPYVLNAWKDGANRRALVFFQSSWPQGNYLPPHLALLELDGAGALTELASAEVPSTIGWVSYLNGFRIDPDTGGYDAIPGYNYDSTALLHVIHVAPQGEGWAFSFQKIPLPFQTKIDAVDGVDLTPFQSGQGVLPVASTVGYPTSGQVAVEFLGGMLYITYTGKTATSFTGCQVWTYGTLPNGAAVVSTNISSYWQQNQDPAWSLDLAKSAQNGRPCGNIIGTVDLSDPVTGQWVTRTFDFDLAGGTASMTLHGFDPLAPTGTTTFDFTPSAVTGSVVTLDPSVGPGNAWTSSSPDPNATDPIWQYATYIGNEQLVCDGQPCNKRYWNVAIGFDPTASNCSVEYMATAGTPENFDASGVPLTTGTWPVIHYQAQLTGIGGADNLVCRQNPLDATGSGVATSYVNGAQFCHSFDGTLPAATVPGCATTFPLAQAQRQVGVR